GLKRESEIDRTQSITHVTGKRLDYTIIGLLVAAIAMFALVRFVPRAPAAGAGLPANASAPGEFAAKAAPTSPATEPVSVAAAPDEKSIAVLPFVNMSEEKANEYFS